MTLDTVDIIVQRLIDFDYKNTVSICGYGEPTLHKDLPTIISKLRSSNVTIELITNGDLLTTDNINQYFDNGLSLVNVSIYDIETDIKITQLLMPIDSSRYVIKRKYIETPNLVNRISILNKKGKTKSNPCYLTSYKMMVDIDGDVLLCCNEWDRLETFGNLQTSSIETIWLDNMNQRRELLINGDRSIGACQYCDVQGNLAGEDSVKLFQARM